MSNTRNLLLGFAAATSVLAIASSSLAQDAGQGFGGPGGPGGGGRGPGGQGGPGGQNAEARAKAQHDALKITPAQEAAWTAYQAAIRPAGGFGGGRGPGGGAGGPGGQGGGGGGGGERPPMTPEMQAQMQAQMQKRQEAATTFRAVLSAEQQAIFDAMPQGGRGGRGGPGGQGGGPRPPQ